MECANIAVYPERFLAKQHDSSHRRAVSLSLYVFVKVTNLGITPKNMQPVPVLRIRIRIIFGPDPDPYYSEKLDPDLAALKI
jgi:hypothetical protein